MRQAAEQIFPNGMIWSPFLLHIAKPHIHPIADRYVYRAYSLHMKVEVKEPYTWATYEAYSNYFGQIAATMNIARTKDNIPQLKRIDNALMVFGQFLTAYYPILALEPSRKTAKPGQPKAMKHTNTSL
jgi:hypothetical protein